MEVLRTTEFTPQEMAKRNAEDRRRKAVIGTVIGVIVVGVVIGLCYFVKSMPKF